MSVPAHSNDDSLSHRVAPEWFQPELCVPSDLPAEPVWPEVTDSTELKTAQEWFQPELSVPSEPPDLTAEAVWIEVTDSTELTQAPEWFQPELSVPPDLTAEPVWLEVSNSTELTPADIWSPDYEEDITLQGNPAEDVVEEFTEDRFINLNAIEASRHVRILDEFQFLPSDASFATVTINEQIEPATATLQEPANVDDSITIDRSRVRLLDETDVLQDEQSFATVLTNQPRRLGAYSAQKEFLLKTGLSSTQFMLAKLLVVSVISVAALLFLIIAGGVFKSNPTMTNAPHTAALAPPGKPQAKAVTPSGSPASVPVSDNAVHQAANSLLPGKNETKLKSSSEPAPRTSRETVTSNAPPVPSRQKEPTVKTSAKKARSLVAPTASARDKSINSTNTSKKRHNNERANVSVRRATGAHASERNVGSRAERKPTASSTKAIAQNAKEKPTVSVVSGGGQRPRRVTP